MPRQLIVRDPRLFAPPERPPEPYKLALGLDLGTMSGAAFVHFAPGRPFALGDSPVYLSQLDLSSDTYESGALRFVKLRRFLAVLDPDVIFYEQVRNTPPMADLVRANRFTISGIAARISGTAQLFGALMATVGCWAEQYGVPSAGVGIAAIKKRATGKGNAGKADIIAAMNRLLGTDYPVDDFESSGMDNVADAFFALILGLEAYADGVDTTPRPPGSRAASEPE